MDTQLNPKLELVNKSTIKSCSNCLCCMNKELNPFCYELNKSVKLDSIACKEYERN